MDNHSLKDNLVRILILSICFLFIALPRISFPDFDHGDDWADAETALSAKNFVKFGFIKTRFLPFFSLHLEEPKDPYTHYPPLANIFNGLFCMLFKTDSLYMLRVMALFFSFLNLIFWYLFARRVTSSGSIAFLAAIFYLFNPFFIYGADALGQISYADFLRSLILFIFVWAFDSGRERKGLLLVLWCLLFLESLMTFEYIIYLALFFILYSYLFKKPQRFSPWPFVFLLLTASVAGFLLHLAQNAWYFGSIARAFTDFKEAAIKRILSGQEIPVEHFNLFTWFKYVIAHNTSLVFLFDYFILLVAIFFAYLLYQALREESKIAIRQLLRLFLILSICGISWYVFVPAHSLAHAFVYFLVRHLVPQASIGFSLFFYLLLSFIKEKNRYAPIKYLLAISGICLVIFTGINKSELPLTTQNIERAEAFLQFKECLFKLKEMSTKKEQIGLNYYRYPFISYYTERLPVRIFDKASLEALVPLPRYFIFVPYNTQNSQELFVALNQRYIKLRECASGKFPAVIFALKDTQISTDEHR